MKTGKIIANSNIEYLGDLRDIVNKFYCARKLKPEGNILYLSYLGSFEELKECCRDVIRLIERYENENS